VERRQKNRRAGSVEFAGVAREFLRRGRPIAALRPLDLTAGPGEVVAIAGRNGCGKTTALRIAAGLVTPSAGRALVCGFDVSRLPPSEMGLVGVSLGSGRSFYWRLTARQNLFFFGALARVSRRRLRERVPALAGELGLDAVLDEPARRLSRGALARLSVARALLHEPPVVLLDEPCAAVDARGKRDIAAAVLRAVGAGATALVTAQEGSEVPWCGRTVVLSSD
jgi:ABC-2 type transport system ATP-binding protein